MTSYTFTNRANIRIEAHLAKSNPELCEKYIYLHKKELKKINVTNISSFDSSWINLHKCVILIAKDLEENEKIVAGIRIEPWLGYNLLPLEKSLSEFSEVDCSEILKKEDIENIAEVCGLWVSYNKPGLGRIITRAAFSIFPQLKIKKSIALVSHLTLRTASLMGYQCLRNYGNKGAFPYPNSEHKSYIMYHSNASSLEDAHQRERENIQELNKKKILLRSEPKKNSRFLIQYRLNLESEIKRLSKSNF